MKGNNRELSLVKKKKFAIYISWFIFGVFVVEICFENKRALYLITNQSKFIVTVVMLCDVLMLMDAKAIWNNIIVVRLEKNNLLVCSCFCSYFLSFNFFFFFLR